MRYKIINILNTIRVIPSNADSDRDYVIRLPDMRDQSEDTLFSKVDTLIELLCLCYNKKTRGYVCYKRDSYSCE
jgi:hypothetical protein